MKRRRRGDEDEEVPQGSSKAVVFVGPLSTLASASIIYRTYMI